jgi:hypothetical protein
MAMFRTELLKSYFKTVEETVLDRLADANTYIQAWISQTASDVHVLVEQETETLDPVFSPYADAFATFKEKVFVAVQSQENQVMALRIILIAMMVFTSWRTFKNLRTQKELYVSL